MSNVDFCIPGIIGSTVSGAVDKLEMIPNKEINVEIICPEESQIRGDFL